MKIITISREFGSGGRELGKRLADYLGFDYYDSEIIQALSRKSGMDEDYIENALSNHGWQNVPVTFRATLSGNVYYQSDRIGLLIQQKQVIEEIAAAGKDCIIVGRNADVILAGYHPFNIFVCAEMDAKLRRCMERAPQGEQLSERELIQKIRHVDRVRAQTRELVGGPAWGQRSAYHLTINTSAWTIKALTQPVAGFAQAYFGRNN